jgi:hypothetical protein
MTRLSSSGHCRSTWPMRPLGASAMELVIAPMSSTPFAPRIRPSVSSFRRQRRRAGINRDDRSGPAEFVHSFAQRTWADELADDIRLPSAFERGSGDRPLQARDWRRVVHVTMPVARGR